MNGSGTGWFAADDAIAFEATRTVDGTDKTTWEVWQLGPDGSTITRMPQGFTNTIVDCA